MNTSTVLQLKEECEKKINIKPEFMKIVYRGI